MEKNIGTQKAQIRVGINSKNEILYYYEICQNNSIAIAPDGVEFDDETKSKEVEIEVSLIDLYDSKTLYRKLKRKFDNKE